MLSECLLLIQTEFASQKGWLPPSPTVRRDDPTHRLLDFTKPIDTASGAAVTEPTVAATTIDTTPSGTSQPALTTEQKAAILNAPLTEAEREKLLVAQLEEASKAVQDEVKAEPLLQLQKELGSMDDDLRVTQLNFNTMLHCVVDVGAHVGSLFQMLCNCV